MTNLPKGFQVNKSYLVTGSAGFIGYYLCKKLLDQGYTLVGIDNLNDYYDVNLKYTRLEILEQYDNFTFIKADISDKAVIENFFREISTKCSSESCSTSGCSLLIRESRRLHAK